MSRYVADTHRHRVHSAEAAACPIHQLPAEHRVETESPEEVRMMVELEAYDLCPECMGEFDWE
ncbi:hypothetical protein [Limnochorda pilosa]|uniref:Uncharacterized protein n=1 Tax=Limnochorda pilosa TaxID=1555112 RepID=A0A0K2SIT1_LIMPI|nr:hypothetical protein [Limnochorda pilosa]BAS27036.1 hypothetical protein LIP_1179 [Limnochorda pilosa]